MTDWGLAQNELERSLKGPRASSVRSFFSRTKVVCVAFLRDAKAVRARVRERETKRKTRKKTKKSKTTTTTTKSGRGGQQQLPIILGREYIADEDNEDEAASVCDVSQWNLSCREMKNKK